MPKLATKKPSKRYYTYKLLAGKYAQGAKLKPNGKKTDSEVYVAGTDKDTFTTSVDLFELFGPSARYKFRLVGTNDPDQAGTIPPAIVESPMDYEDDVIVEDEELEVDEEDVDDGLDDMSVPQLKKYANDQGVDIGQARRKPDIIEAIRDELTTTE